MKICYFLIILFGLLNNNYAQAPLIWSSDFDAELVNYYSNLPSVKMDGDSIIINGVRNSPSGQQISLVNYNLDGVEIGTLTIGADSAVNNTIIDYQFDANNNSYILHKNQIGFYKSAILLQKYAPDGNLLWVRKIESIGDTSYTPYDLALINDTCIFVTAYRDVNYPEFEGDGFDMESIAQVYRYTLQGDNIWQRSFDAELEIDRFNTEMFIYNSEAFFFSTNDGISYKILKLDINNSLDIITDTDLYGGIKSIQLTPDNHMLIIRNLSYALAKYDLNGILIWSQTVATNLPENVCCDGIASVVQDLEGNIFVTGKHYGANYGTATYTNADILTIKLNPDGNIDWENRYIFDTNNADIGMKIKLFEDHIYIGGESQGLGVGEAYDYVLLKLDSASGTTNGVYRFNGIENGNDVISDIFIFENGNILLTGVSWYNPQYGWTTQLLADIETGILNTSNNSTVQLFPNPVKGGQTISIAGAEPCDFQIFNMQGEMVQSGKLIQTGQQEVQLNQLPAGLYVFSFKINQQIVYRKISIL